MSFDELQVGAGTPLDPPAIVGEAEAGRAAKVRKQINKLITQSNAAAFDLMDLLHESKTKNYIRDWGFESYSEYAKSLDIKYSQAFYFVAIKAAMVAADLTREQYEPVGRGKLRIIARLKPENEYKGIPGTLVIRELTLKAANMTSEEVQFEVDALEGKVDDDAMCWLNIHIKKLARENVVKPAIEKIRKFLPQTTDDEGKSHDAGDGACLESICANFLADPNFDEQEPENALTPAGDAEVVPPEPQEDLGD